LMLVQADCDLADCDLRSIADAGLRGM